MGIFVYYTCVLIVCTLIHNTHTCMHVYVFVYSVVHHPMQDKRHLIAVNVSPIDRGHVLLVPEPASCLPQVSRLLQL